MFLNCLKTFFHGLILTFFMYLMIWAIFVLG